VDFAARLFSLRREVKGAMTPPEDALVLRRRSPWEAADAGLLLWRANFFYFLPFFALPFWLCAFGLRLLPEKILPWSWFILWYLKPLFDRPILHVISVRFFEPRSGTGRLLRDLGKTIFRGLPGDLLWRRFSPLRSAVMPLRILEKLRGKGIKQRKAYLEKGGLYFCAFLTIWGAALELVFLAGEVLFSLIMIELLQEDYISSLGGFFINSEIFFFAAWCFNYMLVESIYVCTGFGLYINSRVELEGWDIEILFRKFTEARKKKMILPGAPVFLLFVLLFLPLRAQAEETGAGPGIPPSEAPVLPGGFSAEPGAGAPLETLDSILSSKDFGGMKEGWGIRLKDRKTDRELPDPKLVPWMKTIKQVFAFILRLMLVLGLCGFGGFLIFYFYKSYKNRRRKTALPGGWTMNGRGNPRGESPEALLQKAQALYAEGNIRRAWGFCLAALIQSWSRYRALIFPPDATEYDCLALVRAERNAGAADAAGTGPGAAGSREAESFALAVGRWVALAYGGRFPPAGSFEETLAFCRSLNPALVSEKPGVPGKIPEAGGVQ
jgi:hypothetical protein